MANDAQTDDKPQRGTLPPAQIQPDKTAADNRGHKPGIGPNGEVTGSGAGAGGGGNPEDYDEDRSGGSGQANPSKKS